MAVAFIAAGAVTACSSDRITDSRIATSSAAQYSASSNTPPLVVNVSNDTAGGESA
jgi:hypothetical protein